MPIIFTCDCGRVLQVAEVIPGRKARCPHCGRRSAIPREGDPLSGGPATSRAWISMLGVVVFLVGVVVGLAVLLRLGFSGHDASSANDAVALNRVPPEQPPQPATPSELEQPKDRGLLADAASRKPEEQASRSEHATESTPAPSTLLEAKRPDPGGQSPLEALQPREEPNKAIPIEDKPVGSPNAPADPQRGVGMVPERPAAPRLLWSLPAKRTFIQEVVVSQSSASLAPGLDVPMRTTIRYTVVSRLTVEKEEEDGTVVVAQQVESARLVEADDLVRPLLAPAVRDLRGITFTITLNAQRQVVDLEGEFSSARTANLGGGGFAHVSLLDRDGWKELHQATFFQPNRHVQPGDRWSMPTTHSWGALGTWKGWTHYGYAGRQGRLHRFDYRFELAHASGAAALGPIAHAAFRHQPSGGTIWFDPERGRVSAVEERFHVQGRIRVNFLGQVVPVDLEEVQQFRVTIHDREPSGR